MEDADGLCQSARLGIGDTAILVATDDRDRSSDDIAHSVYTVDNACIFHTAHFTARSARNTQSEPPPHAGNSSVTSASIRPMGLICAGTGRMAAI